MDRFYLASLILISNRKYTKIRYLWHYSVFLFSANVLSIGEILNAN